MTSAPTPKQLNTLRTMAVERGVSFEWPTTSHDAHRQIELLKKTRRSPRHEIRADRDATTRDKFDSGVPSIRADEITGYGSTATWKGR